MNGLAEYISQDGCLLARAAGPWTVEAARDLIDGARREAARYGHNRLLLDLTRWRTPDSEWVRFQSGAYLAAVLGPPLKVAAFANSEAINRFGEMAAINRFAWFRLFADEREAIRWLLGDAEPPAANR